jgi:N-methylhydantoinase A
MKQLCVDVGGTFTDCLVLDGGGELRKFKASTTPADPTGGFFASVGKAASFYGSSPGEFLAEVDLIVHGTTLGTNVLLTKNGATTGFITTKGFRDVIEMRRGIKNLHGSMFDQFIEPYEPLVPRHRRLGVSERTLYTGQVVEAVDDREVEEAAGRLLGEGCEAIAVGFLHSYANPENERRAKAIVERVAPEAYVTASHEILPAWREFERFSTAAVSAYIGPAVARYLRKLREELAGRGFGGTLLIMQGNGMVQTVEQCIGRGAYLLTSGPAAAPSGAKHVGALHGRENLLEVDMGGTSFDVCLIKDGVIPTTTDAWVGEERVAIKMVDVSSVGAGGGSIAWIDSLGLLRVGPQSAGADPGPAAYGRSDEATVTDADLVLGYVPADYFLGGEMNLDVERSRRALERVGKDLGMDPVETARAVYATATSVMADEITEVCTKKGLDVRDFTLVAGGGAGGVHAAAIARRLSIPEVIVPRVSALMSAFGMFTMDLGSELTRSRFSKRSGMGPDELSALYQEMQQEAESTFAEMGVVADRLRHVRSVEARYEGQFHEVEVEMDGGEVTEEALERSVRRFHEEYGKLYGYSMPWLPVELLTFHLSSTAGREPPLALRSYSATGADVEGARRGSRECVFEDGAVETAVYDGDRLQPGHRIVGPAVIDDRTTSVLVLEGFTCEVDEHLNLVLRLEAAGKSREGTGAAAVSGQRDV